MPNLALLVLRLTFLVVATLLGTFVIKGAPALAVSAWPQLAALGTVIGIALGTIGIDMAVRRKQLDTISAIYFGLIVGLFLTYIASLALEALPFETDDKGHNANRDAIVMILGMVLCYICISLLLQTRNDFRFIIPYVEFAKEVKGSRPFVLDTSVVIDGRIADVVETKVVDSPLIMPRFVLNELHSVADSSDRMRRSRGRRGLDVLNRLRSSNSVDLQMFDRELPEFAAQPVDIKLVLLAKHLEGKIITNDYNLNKVARLHGVDVLNLNDLSNALKPVFLPGESVTVRVVKPGEEAGQGVGYLDDGTMVVIEGGRDHVNETVRIAVTSVLQTSAGRMVFGRFEGSVSD